MKKFLKITILWLLFVGNSYAIENWEIKKVIDGKFTQVSTTGLITYGAEYKLLIRNNNICKTVEDNFVFYTTKNNPNIMKIIGKKVKDYNIIACPGCYPTSILLPLIPLLKNKLVICNIGLPSQELFKINDQPNYFYMLGSMGLCSSIGLGLALSQKKRGNKY